MAITLTINNQTVEVEAGATVLEAAQKAGFDVPTMCTNGETEHFASCMICVVKDLRTGGMLPACSSKAVEGANLITDDAELSDARKLALELLMSEHVGDCEAPCTVACPASMDIPSMNRLLAQGLFEEALKVVRKNIALPGILGRICPAPCEGVCRRKPMDQAVSICLLKRAAFDFGASADSGAASNNAQRQPTLKDFRVAVVGAGPAGLSAAYYLRIRGISVDLLDAQELPGGSLRYHLPEGLLDQTVLDAEISYVLSTGVNFRPGVNLGKESFAELQQTYDAVVLATGNVSEAQSEWGLKQDGKQFLVDKGSFQTSVNNVFAIGNANRPGKLAIRSAAQGKEVAFSVEQLLLGQPVTGEFKRFNSTIGKLYPDEYAEYLQQASKAARTDPENGLSRDLVMQEAARCMDCDCRKIDSCLLREHSERFRIARRRFAYSERVRVSRKYTSDLVVYEPGKCIKCGICVRLTAKYNETFGFTYIGRGFDVVIGVPFDASLELALEKTATKVVEACPTGALGRLNRKP